MALMVELRNERAALCDTLDVVGPDAPTLCHGWEAADLAAHVADEDRLGGLVVLLLTPFDAAAPRRHRTAVRHAAVGRRMTAPLRSLNFGDLVTHLRRGPGRFLHAPGVAPYFLLENWIHHEDVRRPSGLAGRATDRAVEQVLWRLLPVVFRRSGLPHDVEFVLRTPDGREHRPRKRIAPLVTVTGDVGELLLFVAGRRCAAVVTMSGESEAIARIEASSVGL